MKNAKWKTETARESDLGILPFYEILRISFLTFRYILFQFMAITAWNSTNYELTLVCKHSLYKSEQSLGVWLSVIPPFPFFFLGSGLGGRRRDGLRVDNRSRERQEGQRRQSVPKQTMPSLHFSWSWLCAQIWRGISLPTLSNSHLPTYYWPAWPKNPETGLHSYYWNSLPSLCVN